MNIRILKSVKEIGASAWRRLESPDFPFNDFEFLAALEDSGSVGAGTGWQPVYLVAEETPIAGGSEAIAGVLYAFVKQHSYGEYIFDWQWANFYQAQGLPYYPKLLTAVPFTPATGPRLLVAPGADRARVFATLLKAALSISLRSGMSSYHALFIEEEDVPYFEAEGLAIRHSLQYHWRNKDYRDFQDFLDSLIGKRRRDIIRERQRAQSHGLDIQCLHGVELQAEHATIMEALYQTTTDKKNAIAYLQPGFFQQLFRTMAPSIVLVLASKAGRPIAAALNLSKGQKLYGRYWGSFEPHVDLHFELCYYQTIEYALRNGIDIFEAGAQGEHKIQRGFLPAITRSAHKIFDPRLGPPIEAFIQDERLAIDAALKETSSPFKGC